MEIMRWLIERDDGLAYIGPEEREAVISFALLWMYFEARLLNTWATAKTLKALAGRLEDAKLPIDDASIVSCYDYFRDRYWDGQKPSPYFPKLKLPPELVDEVLASFATPPGPRQRLEACLLIVLRYRNNLFHGTKWLYRLEGQQSNFEHGIRLLRAVISLDDQLKGA